MDNSTTSRRELLRAGGIAAVATLAGCSGGGGGGGSDAKTIPSVDGPNCDSPTELTQKDVEGGTTLSEGCYRVKDGVTVASGTLVLEAGAYLQFANDVGLAVQSGGALKTKGKRSNPVVLTGTEQNRGYWQGVRFVNSQSNDNVLKQTLIEYAGSTQWHGGGSSRGGIFFQKGNKLSLESVYFRGNGQAGIVAGDPSQDLSVSGSVFADNELPAWIHSNYVNEFSAGNTFRNNDNGWILAGVSGARDTLSAGGTWENPGVPVRFTRDVVLKAPVTVASGTTLEFKKGAGLDVPEAGKLTVKGTGDAPVTFTGVEDERASWQGLRFRNNRSDNVVENAIVEDAGDERWHGGGTSRAGIYVQGDDVKLAVRNSTIRNNRKMGITADGGDTNLTLEANTFEGNEAPLWTAANLVGGVAPDNSFQNNDDSFVYVGTGGARTTVDDGATWDPLGIPFRFTRHLNV